MILKLNDGQRVYTETVNEAVELFIKWRDENGLSASDLDKHTGDVVQDRSLLARIAYNGETTRFPYYIAIEDRHLDETFATKEEAEAAVKELQRKFGGPGLYYRNDVLTLSSTWFVATRKKVLP